MIESSTPIRIAIAEDHHILRQGLAELIRSYPEFDMVFDAENGEEVLEKMQENPIDVLILDLNMPKMDGETCLPLALQLHPELKVIVLSMYFSEAFISQLIRLGASAYLPKNIDFNDLRDCIHSVHHTGYYLNSELENMLKAHEGDLNLFDLTEREMEIINMVCQEKTSREIASELFISHRTVEGHKARLQEKIKAKNTAGIVLFALRNGIYR